jgi:hypothetical protein
MTPAERNRRDFPFVEPWKRTLEAAFGPVKVTYATNGTREVGEKFEAKCQREGWAQCAYRPNGVPNENRQ